MGKIPLGMERSAKLRGCRAQAFRRLVPVALLASIALVASSNVAQAQAATATDKARSFTATWNRRTCRAPSIPFKSVWVLEPLTAAPK